MLLALFLSFVPMSFSYPYKKTRDKNYKPKRETVKIRLHGGLHDANFNDIVHVDYINATLLFGTALPEYFVQTSFGGFDMAVLEDFMKMHVKRIAGGFIPHPSLNLPYPPFIPFHEFGNDVEEDDYPNDDEMRTIEVDYGKDYVPSEGSDSDEDMTAGNRVEVPEKASMHEATLAISNNNAEECVDKKMQAVLKEEVEWPNEEDCYILGSKIYSAEFANAALIKTEEGIKKEENSVNTKEESTGDKDRNDGRKGNRSDDCEVIIYHPEVIYMDSLEASAEHQVTLAKKDKENEKNNIQHKRIFARHGEPKWG